MSDCVKFVLRKKTLQPDLDKSSKIDHESVIHVLMENVADPVV